VTSINGLDANSISIHANASMKGRPTVGAPVENFRLPDVRGGDIALYGRNYRDRPSPDTILFAADNTASTHPSTGQSPNRPEEINP